MLIHVVFLILNSTTPLCPAPAASNQHTHRQMYIPRAHLPLRTIYEFGHHVTTYDAKLPFSQQPTVFNVEHLTHTKWCFTVRALDMHSPIITLIFKSIVSVHLRKLVRDHSWYPRTGAVTDEPRDRTLIPHIHPKTLFEIWLNA